MTTSARISIRILLVTAAAAIAGLSTSPRAHAQPPPGYAPAPAPADPSAAPAPQAAPPGVAQPQPPPYPYPYPYPYGPAAPDVEKARRDAARQWEPGAPVPEGYHVESGIRKGLVVGGSVMTGALWFINVTVAAALEKEEHGKFDALYAPVAGPFIAIGTTRSDSLGTLTLVVDGLVQSGGVAMLIAGLATTQEKLVRDASVHVMPVPFTPDDKTAGLGLVGTF